MKVSSHSGLLWKQRHSETIFQANQSIFIGCLHAWNFQCSNAFHYLSQEKYSFLTFLLLQKINHSWTCTKEKQAKTKTKWWISHLAFTFFLCWGLKKSINYWSFRYFLQKWQTNRWAGPLSLSLSCFHVMYNKTYCFTFLISSSFIFK